MVYSWNRSGQCGGTTWMVWTKLLCELRCVVRVSMRKICTLACHWHGSAETASYSSAVFAYGVKMISSLLWAYRQWSKICPPSPWSRDVDKRISCENARRERIASLFIHRVEDPNLGGFGGISGCTENVCSLLVRCYGANAISSCLNLQSYPGTSEQNPRARNTDSVTYIAQKIEKHVQK